MRSFVKWSLKQWLRHSKLGANVGLMSQNSKAQVHAARSDSQRTFTSPRHHANNTVQPSSVTDTQETSEQLRPSVRPEKPVSLKSTSALQKAVSFTSEDGFRENCSHVARRGDGSIGAAGKPAASVAYTLLENKSILHKPEKKKRCSQ